MTATRRQAPIAPSPVFYGLLAVTIGLGALLWKGYDLGGTGVFLFVVIGWIVSLTLHEFGHAVVAYIGGDRSVADKGYLTLDVRKYADPGTSLLFPIMILLIGGIGLPGGAVWINNAAIPSRAMRSLVSAAGPAASGACAVVCLVPLRAGWINLQQHTLFAIGLAFLGAIQVIALLFNLVPVPGLDGYGIIDPHLSPATRQALAPARQYGILLFIIALWFIPTVGDAFWSVTDRLSILLGGEYVRELRALGWQEFRFWE